MQELERIYALLDELEPVDVDTQPFRPAHALYPWPLATALMLAVAPLWFYLRGHQA
jgi:Ca-activated chloride channel family protein